MFERTEEIPVSTLLYTPELTKNLPVPETIPQVPYDHVLLAETIPQVHGSVSHIQYLFQ